MTYLDFICRLGKFVGHPIQIIGLPAEVGGVGQVMLDYNLFENEQKEEILEIYETKIHDRSVSTIFILP